MTQESENKPGSVERTPKVPVIPRNNPDRLVLPIVAKTESVVLQLVLATAARKIKHI